MADFYFPQQQQHRRRQTLDALARGGGNIPTVRSAWWRPLVNDIDTDMKNDERFLERQPTTSRRRPGRADHTAQR
jgi:hypothetical protein